MRNNVAIMRNKKVVEKKVTITRNKGVIMREKKSQLSESHNYEK